MSRKEIRNILLLIAAVIFGIVLCMAVFQLFSLPDAQHGRIADSGEYAAEEERYLSKIPSYTEDCEMLSPVPFEEERAVTLAFHDKTKITEKKFGFRKKIVFDEPVVLRQYIEADRYFFYYGLYRDERLEKPVIEVDTKYNSDAFAKMEEGADKKDFPEYREGYTIKVSPGIYYLGVYTRDPSLTEGISYQCESIPYQEEEELLPGRSQFYTPVDEKDSILFKIEPDSDRIEILADVWKGAVQLLDGEKQAIGDPVMLML